jgi:hypothetical protein
MAKESNQRIENSEISEKRRRREWRNESVAAKSAASCGNHRKWQWHQ